MRSLPNPPHLIHLGKLWLVGASLLSILIGLYQGRRRVKRR